MKESEIIEFFNLEPKTKFEEIADFFMVTFKRGNVNIDTYKTTQKTTQKIIELIKENPQITREELAKIIGITSDGIKYNLGKLKKEGKIKRIGSAKGGHWEVIDE